MDRRLDFATADRRFESVRTPLLAAIVGPDFLA